VTAVAAGALIYKGSLRLNMQRFFKWTGVFILFVAAGLLSSSLKAFHEAGLWNHLQTTAYDLTQVLPTHSVLGVLLGALFGYQDAPAIGEVLIWFLFIVPALLWFLPNKAPKAGLLPQQAP